MSKFRISVCLYNPPHPQTPTPIHNLEPIKTLKPQPQTQIPKPQSSSPNPQTSIPKPQPRKSLVYGQIMIVKDYTQTSKSKFSSARTWSVSKRIRWSKTYHRHLGLSEYVIMTYSVFVQVPTPRIIHISTQNRFKLFGRIRFSIYLCLFHVTADKICFYCP